MHDRQDGRGRRDKAGMQADFPVKVDKHENDHSGKPRAEGDGNGAGSV